MYIRARRRTLGRVVYEPAARVRHRVPQHRCSVRYFISRCYFEGQSKAVVAALAGTESLAAELYHATRVLPRGVARELAAAVRERDGGAAIRAGAIITGLTVTTAGYIVGRLREGTGRIRQRNAETTFARPDTRVRAKVGRA
jgi:hypothetical protein